MGHAVEEEDGVQRDRHRPRHGAGGERTPAGAAETRQRWHTKNLTFREMCWLLVRGFGNLGLKLISLEALEQARASSFLKSLDDTKPWYSPMEYIEAVASLATVYAEEMTRKTHVQSRTIAQLLWSACSAERFQWYFNNIRYRRSIERQMA